MLRLPVALALAVLSAGAARATPVPPDLVQWYYDWTPGASSLSSTNAPVGYVNFTDEASFATGPSQIVATYLGLSSGADPLTPNTLGANGAYTLRLDLTTIENGTLFIASHTFSGKLSGPFSVLNSAVKNTFDVGAGSEWTYQLGSYDFHVTLNDYVPPGPPSQGNWGNIGASVSVALHDGWPTIPPVPEPGTLTLGGVSLACLGVTRWRTRLRRPSA